MLAYQVERRATEKRICRTEHDGKDCAAALVKADKNTVVYVKTAGKRMVALFPLKLYRICRMRSD
jgi:hypothetical protein